MHTDVHSLLRQKETLLRDVHHRVANSLQIIASLLAMDARKVHSDEARQHLENAHRRIMAVAAVQRQLQISGEEGAFEIAAYLCQLCQNLTESLVGDSARIAIDFQGDAATVPSTAAMNMGLIVTELVINALKHAFPADSATGIIIVTYRVGCHGWRLTVSDNGVGRPIGSNPPTTTGLGSGIVAALVGQLAASIETSTGQSGFGTLISISGRIEFPTH